MLIKEHDYSFEDLDKYTFHSLQAFKAEKAQQFADLQKKRYDLIASIMFYQKECKELLDDMDES